MVGVIVQLYNPNVHQNHPIFPFPIVTSVDMKLYTGSVNVPVTLNVVLVHAPTADDKVTPGAVVSILMSLLNHNEYCAHGLANVKVAVFNAASLILHQSKMSALVFR